jgi:hypothetical protein
MRWRAIRYRAVETSLDSDNFPCTRESVLPIIRTVMTGAFRGESERVPVDGFVPSSSRPVAVWPPAAVAAIPINYLPCGQYVGHARAASPAISIGFVAATLFHEGAYYSYGASQPSPHRTGTGRLPIEAGLDGPEQPPSRKERLPKYPCRGNREQGDSEAAKTLARRHTA